MNLSAKNRNIIAKLEGGSFSIANLSLIWLTFKFKTKGQFDR